MLPFVPPPLPTRRHVQMGASRCRSVCRWSAGLCCRCWYRCARQPGPAGPRSRPLGAGARGGGAQLSYTSGSLLEVAGGTIQVLMCALPSEMRSPSKVARTHVAPSIYISSAAHFLRC